MPAANMTTTKIDRDSLAKLRMLADREKRSQPAQLAVLIDAAFRANPAELTDPEFLRGIMDTLVENAEAGIVAETAIRRTKEFSAADRISWGEEDGKIIGVLANGSRCDVDGNILSK
ncbi:MAG: hypothetical protein OXN23_02640 [Gammaproteobacteria bacterium]|nr:hypothetical protein [Gammaproteobacteria bacterium]MDE0302594.1 hypothetical protein [Gammaproteobacteria bacterium]